MVFVLNPCLWMSNQHISWSCFMRAKVRLKPGKAVGADGANAELLRGLPLDWQFLWWLLMNKRYGGDSLVVSWGSAVANLIPKLASAKNLDKFRAVVLDAITLKWYLQFACSSCCGRAVRLSL